MLDAFLSVKPNLNKVYKSDNTFFGEEPSNFAMFCFNYMKSNQNVKKILDLGSEYGRDSIFFALNGFEDFIVAQKTLKYLEIELHTDLPVIHS